MLSRAEERLASGVSEATCSFEAGGPAAVARSREEQVQTRELVAEHRKRDLLQAAEVGEARVDDDAGGDGASDSLSGSSFTGAGSLSSSSSDSD